MKAFLSFLFPPMFVSGLKSFFIFWLPLWLVVVAIASVLKNP